MLAVVLPVYVLLVWHGSKLLAESPFTTASECQEVREIIQAHGYDAECTSPR